MSITRGDIIYHTLKLPVTSYLKLRFNLRVESNAIRGLKEPYLLLGHHMHVLDPVISNACASRLIRYIAGDANQDSPLKRFFLAMMESIPFAKNRSDVKSIREVVRHVREGHPVGLYPEGGRTWDGATDYIIPSTAKLVKLLKIPVYINFYKGGYLTRPRWASHARRGRVEVEIRQLLDKEAVARKSVDELYAILVDKLNYNEYQWQAEKHVPFRGRNRAEHIERLLYVCPSCQSFNNLKSAGDKFSCTNCKKEYAVDSYGWLQGCEDLTDTVAWNQWQRTLLPRLVRQGYSFLNPRLPLERVDTESGTREKDIVQLTLTPDQLRIVGEKGRGEEIATRDINSISATFMDVVEFYVGRIKYRFSFDPRRHMSVKLFYDLLQHERGLLNSVI